jgi:endonuclease YncB( thermonuclease family)
VVEVDPVTTDRYGRTVAFVRVADSLVNEELIRQGLARVFARYCDRPICERWERLEDEATQAGRGLWSTSNALPPLGVPEKQEMTAFTASFLPNLPMS